MTASARTATEAQAQVPRTVDPDRDPTSVGRTVARAGAAVGRRTLQQFSENPLLTLVGTALIAVLILNHNSTNDRITRLENRMDARFAALEEDVADLREEIDDLGEEVDETNLKLTALIAALNTTGGVDAAIEGRLIDRTPDPGPDPTGAAPG